MVAHAQSIVVVFQWIGTVMAPNAPVPLVRRMFALFREGGVEARPHRLAVARSSPGGRSRRLTTSKSVTSAPSVRRSSTGRRAARSNTAAAASPTSCRRSHRREPRRQRGPCGSRSTPAWVRLVLSYDRTVLTGAQKTVLIALETYADYRDGTNAFPGEENLATDTALTTRAVRDAMKRAREIGLIVRTALENPKAGRAAVYRLAMPVSTGIAVPVDNSITGTTIPVDNTITGTPVPVEAAITGTATHHHRNGHVVTTGTAVPPTLHATSNHQGVVSDWGTSPGQLLADTHTDRPPSRFCDDHPRGTRRSARLCKRSNHVRGVAIRCRGRRRGDRHRRGSRPQDPPAFIDACHAAGGSATTSGRLDDLTPCEYPKVSRIEHAS